MRLINLKSILFICFIISIALITMKITPSSTTIEKYFSDKLNGKTPIKVKILENTIGTNSDKEVIITDPDKVHKFVNKIYKYKVVKVNGIDTTTYNPTKKYHISIYYEDNYKIGLIVDNLGYIIQVVPGFHKKGDVTFRIQNQKIDYEEVK
ncbi:hypothetical protein [Clostridium sp.]|uniref:hypothetical protein n=1 Tax=Clostridium sp. TaxID=1506 RepID=UPI002FCB2CDF